MIVSKVARLGKSEIQGASESPDLGARSKRKKETEQVEKTR